VGARYILRKPIISTCFVVSSTPPKCIVIIAGTLLIYNPYIPLLTKCLTLFKKNVFVLGRHTICWRTHTSHTASNANHPYHLQASTSLPITTIILCKLCPCTWQAGNFGCKVKFTACVVKTKFSCKANLTFLTLLSSSKRKAMHNERMI